jgi:hypothetical protein
VVNTWLALPSALGNVHVTSSTGLDGVTVDLNTVGDYSKHKDKLKGLADIAILGEFVNNGGSAIDVEVWMVDNAGPLLTDATVVRADGVRVWGPFQLDAGATTNITWDQSAVLIGAGKAHLLAQIKGDGIFTLYAIGPAGSTIYDFSVNNGKLIAVIDAGP